MHDADKLIRRLACEDAVLAFMSHFDDGNAAGMLALFAEDGEWRRADTIVRGRQALARLMAERDPGIAVRHVITNLFTEFDGDGEACVTSTVTVYRHDFPGAAQLPAPLSGPALVGRYTDELRAIDGRWQIVRKRVQPFFKRTGEQK